MTPPIVREHGGVSVVSDDLFSGGTKARFMPVLFESAEEAVYASPAEGGAQTALARHLGLALSHIRRLLHRLRAGCGELLVPLCHQAVNVRPVLL